MTIRGGVLPLPSAERHVAKAILASCQISPPVRRVGASSAYHPAQRRPTEAYVSGLHQLLCKQPFSSDASPYHCDRPRRQTKCKMTEPPPGVKVEKAVPTLQSSTITERPPSEPADASRPRPPVSQGCWSRTRM